MAIKLAFPPAPKSESEGKINTVAQFGSVSPRVLDEGEEEERYKQQDSCSNTIPRTQEEEDEEGDDDDDDDDELEGRFQRPKPVR
ncbi:unnamed protein product [Echinostoma caproni]|uniref:Uncharacterized protein n=1 Tax=Echinostoma caproni TaxID=27848 RepID=A0A183BFE1_9TREM|nr:unnamed protein product [Echinostoma caproni]